MKYKLLLWDFDGTLADTLSLALEIYNQLATERNFKRITDHAAVREMNMREFLKSHGVSAYQIPFVFSAFLKRLKQLAPEICLNKGIGTVLKRVNEMGVRQGIVSSNTTDNIQSCLRSNGAESLFEHVCGTSRILGKERSLKKAVRKFQLKTSDVLYVGDEIRDIEAARAAGLDVAAVAWGLNSAAALSSHRPTHLVVQPEELLAILGG